MQTSCLGNRIIPIKSSSKEDLNIFTATKITTIFPVYQLRVSLKNPIALSFFGEGVEVVKGKVFRDTFVHDNFEKEF